METLFNIVRPTCIKVSKTRSFESINELQAVISKFEAKTIQEIHEYLMFPLRIVLQVGATKEDTSISAATCLKGILQKVLITNWNVYQDLFKTLLLKISSVDEGKIVTDGSEDIMIAVTNCLDVFVKHSMANLWNQFYSVHNFPILGHLVTICLQIVEHEECRALKLSAMSVISSLCKPSYSEMLPEAEQDLFLLLRGNCLSSFLPGILSSICKVIVGDVKHGHSVKCKALDVTSIVITVVLGDYSILIGKNEDLKSKLEKLDSESNKINPKLESLKVKRSKKWLSDVSPKVNLVLKKIFVLAQNPSSTVRLSLVNFCDTILNQCCKSGLKESAPTLLKGPILLLNDIQPSVIKASTLVVKKFISSPGTDAYDIVADLLFEHCSTLPEILRNSSDIDRLKAVQLLLGYLTVLKTDLVVIFQSTIQFNKLAKSLQLCCEFDASASISQDEINTVLDDTLNMPLSFLHGQLSHWLFKKKFLNFNDGEIPKVLVKICKLLGSHGDIEVLLDFFTESYENKSTCCQSVFLITEIILGICNGPNYKDASRHIAGLLDLYCTPENWQIVTVCNSEYQKSTMKRFQHTKAVLPNHTTKHLATNHIQHNVLLASLQLEAVSSFAKVLGNDFRANLMVALYPVMEKVHDESTIVASCAIKTLHLLSKYCGYENLAGMLCDNADYLVSTISVQLRHLSLFPKCTSVLYALLQHSDVSIFSLIRDTVSEILESLDLCRHDNPHLLLFLPVLLAIVRSIRKWFNLGQSKTNQLDTFSSTDADLSNQTNGIREFIFELHRNIEIAAGQLDDVDDSSEDHTESVEKSSEANDQFEDNTDEITVTAEVKIIKQVLERCCHLMSNTNPKVRLLVMEIVVEALKSLSQEENTLLPLVHQLWTPLQSRFKDFELQVVSRAFDVVWIIALTAGDFVQRRFSKDVLPKLLQFLETHYIQSETVDKNSQVVYKHSALFKLTKNLLEKLGMISRRVQLNFNDFQKILNATYKFLSTICVEELQDAALTLFDNLITVDADAVWYFLTDIYSPQKRFINPLVKYFDVVNVSGSNDPTNVFAKNIRILLKKCGC